MPIFLKGKSMKVKVYKQLTEDAKDIRKKVFMEEQGFVNELHA